MNKNEKQIVETKVENTGVVFNIDDVDVRNNNGVLWFKVADVAKCIEYVKPENWDRWLDKDEITFLQIEGIKKTMKFVSESGLYRILIKTDVPKAKPFERWVTKEVIPSIRKPNGNKLLPLEPVKENLTMQENKQFVFNLSDIDVFEKNNILWFCLADIGSVLEIGKPTLSDWVHRHHWFDKDEIEFVKNELGGHDKIYVAESGLYRILNKSNSPKAKPFERWVTKEVIPSIRKTGSYTVMPTKSKEELEIESNRIKVEGDKIKVESDKVKIEIANIYMKLSQKYNDNKTYAQILDSYATKSLEDKFVLPLPERTEENFSATEVGKKLGISANSVGKIANKLGIKVDGEYGTWYVDKSPYCNKEANVFRYNQKAVNLIKKEIM